MTSLTTPPIQPLVERLYADAERSMTEFRRASEELRARGLDSSSEEYHSAFRQTYLAVTPETGRLLYLLVRSHKPQVVVEFGMSFGVSTIHLAAGLRDNGGGVVVTTEMESNKISAAKESLAEAGLADLVDVREGDALQTLSGGLPGPVGLLFLDGWKDRYLDVLHLLEPSLAPNALIVADNADNAPDYRRHVREDARFVSTMLDERVELSMLVA